MKQVTFARDMRPYGRGQQLLVPDDVAARLVAAGDVEADPPSFPQSPAPLDQAKPRPARRGAYQTKGAA